MAQQHASRHTTVTDEDRREFLKALGVTGAVAASGVTLSEVHSSVSATEELAPVGQAIANDLSGSLDAALIREGQAGVAAAAAELPASLEAGLPGEAVTEPRSEFAAVADAATPVYEHLVDAGFFASTAENLPEFNLETLGAAIESFVASDALVGSVEGFGLGEHQGADLLATVIGNAEQLATHHWVADEHIPRNTLPYGETIPPMTQLAAGGAMIWMGDIDNHLWQRSVLITEEMHADAVWHGQSMAAGFYLMSEAARIIGAESGALTESELGALLTTSFAVQAISQGLLPQDVYYITEEMRAPRA